MPQSLGLCVLRPTEIARSVFCLGSDHTEPCLESRSALAGTPGCRQELSSAMELLCWAPTFLWGSQGIYGIHQSLPACSTQQSPFSQSWNVLSNSSVSPEPAAGQDSKPHPQLPCAHCSPSVSPWGSSRAPFPSMACPQS